VRRLLLLLVRCLAVLLFVLLLARPVLQAPGAAFREGELGFTVVILDTSLSMTALAADSRPRFEAARDLARGIASPAGVRERFALIEAHRSPAVSLTRRAGSTRTGSPTPSGRGAPSVAEPGRAPPGPRLLRPGAASGASS
jgi:hypothetical protein